jgi:hypothetical protein
MLVINLHALSRTLLDKRDLGVIAAHLNEHT